MPPLVTPLAGESPAINLGRSMPADTGGSPSIEICALSGPCKMIVAVLMSEVFAPRYLAGLMSTHG